MRLLLLPLWVSLAAAPLSARALVMEGRTNQQLTQRATAIVRGQVIDHSTVDVAGSGLWTTYQVRVLETFKGEPRAGDLISVGQFGGTLNGQRQSIPGDAQLTDGEEVVVFLAPGHGGFVLTEFSQAKFHVEDDPVTGSRMVSRDFGASGFVRRDAEGMRPATGPANAAVKLEDFRAEILSYVRASR